MSAAKKLRRIYLASQNAHKVRELTELFRLHGIKQTIVSMQEWKNRFNPIEDGDSFAANALIKAQAALALSERPSLADDSGLCVDALNGAPGIHSARFAGVGCSDQDNNEKLLNSLKDQQGKARAAHYVCHLTLLLPGGLRFDSEARWHGQIASEPSGEGGFGYDPLFYLPDKQCTAAELLREEKHRLSHRGQAVLLLIQQLRQAGLLS